VYDLLFRAAWESLRHVVQTEQHFEPAAVMVLHTWNQKLDAHAHVHALVPGGGPSLTSPGTWAFSRPPAHENQTRAWLVDANVLRVEFRTRFLAGLRRLHRKGKLKLTGSWAFLRSRAAFDAWLKPLQSVSWVTYIEKPPVLKGSDPNCAQHPPGRCGNWGLTPLTPTENLVKYLARYMTGGPISDQRLVNHHDGMVTFKARVGKTHGGSDETEDVPLPGAEFVRRWCLHILPKGYTKTRRFGGYSNHHCERFLKQCRELLGANVASEQPAETPETPTSSEEVLHGPRCPHCEIPLRCVGGAGRPSWWSVLTSPLRPVWYDDA
jgi:hypothetical protein